MNRVADYLEFMKNRPEEFIPLEKFNIVTDKAILEQYDKDVQPIGLIYQNPWVTFVADLIHDNEKYFVYTRVIPTVRGGGGVVIIPIFQNKIVFVKHIRHAVRSMPFMLELPRGFLDENTSVQEQISKELYEEIGCSDISKVEIIGKTIANSGENGAFVTIAYAILENYSYYTHDKEEGITSIEMLTFEEAEEKISNGTIVDGFTQSAICLYKIKSDKEAK